MLRIGLTGGIASGKSSVADRFVELGASLVDTDQVARDVVLPGAAGALAVRKAFGDEVFGPDGSLDRARLRAIVFADRAQRQRLEGILHPLIRAQTRQEIQDATGPYVLVAVPLLVETQFRSEVDRVLLVHCTAEQQLARLRARDGIDAAAAQAMIDAQASQLQRMAVADDIIDNSGSPQMTRRQTDRLHERYLERVRDCRAAPRNAE